MPLGKDGSLPCLEGTRFGEAVVEWLTCGNKHLKLSPALSHIGTNLGPLAKPCYLQSNGSFVRSALVIETLSKEPVWDTYIFITKKTQEL